MNFQIVLIRKTNKIKTKKTRFNNRVEKNIDKMTLLFPTITLKIRRKLGE